jgi:uncharacterized damage-inducible protein DinB
VQYDEIPRSAGEKETLVAFLRWQRSTLQHKCDGLSAEQLRTRSAPPSTLSLLGLVRHLADVERGWFRITLNGETLDYRYASDDDPDGEFDNVDGADSEQDIAAWHEECELADRVIDSHDLDAEGTQRTGRRVSLRWILVHMVEEYSRHNGHADLLRERIDGATGYD